MDRLSDERKIEIYRFALLLVDEVGYDRVTMEQVAKASHSSTATLYRRWGSKVQLFVEALDTLNPPLPDGVAADTGSFESDLKSSIAIIGEGSNATREFVAAHQFAAAREPELADAYRRTMGRQLQPIFAEVLGRAIDRGEIAADCPALRYLPMMLTAPGVMPAVLADLDWDPETGVYSYIDAVILPSLGITPTTNSTPNSKPKPASRSKKAK